MIQLNRPIDEAEVQRELHRIRPFYEEVQKQIRDVCMQSGRHPEDVRLIAVTKYHSPAAAAAALHLGITDLAENRTAPFLERRELLAHYCEQQGLRKPAWHFVGSLQRNKVKQLAGKVDTFHALDSLRLARRISSVYVERGETLPVYLQINVTGEASKHGFESTELREIIGDLKDLPNLQVAGLMTMAEKDASADRLKDTFRHLAELAGEFSAAAGSDGKLNVEEPLRLSMGMSGDYQYAVAAGATDIRLGTALFGPRENMA